MAGRGVTRSVCTTGLATTPVAPACPIRLVSYRLTAKDSTEAGRLFPDGEVHFSAAPHWLPREQALQLAHIQRQIWRAGARVLLQFQNALPDKLCA